MDEEDFKADAPAGYDDTTTKIKLKRGRHYRHHPRTAFVQKNKNDWTEEHEQQMDEEQYEKDSPAGYKVEEEKAPQEQPQAPAEAPQPSDEEDVQHKHHSRHHKSRRPRNHVRTQYDDIVREHPWGEIQEEDTAEWLHDNNLRDSNVKQWKTDAPNGYHQAPYEVSDVQMQYSWEPWMKREFPWGTVQEEDTWDYIGTKRDEHSDEKDYVGDAPEGYSAVPYDVNLQIGSQLNKWGVISPEDAPQNVVSKAYESIAQNSADFSKDSPAGYDLVQLNTNKWGVIDEEDTWEWQREKRDEHSDGDTWLEGAPEGYHAVPYDTFVQQQKWGEVDEEDTAEWIINNNAQDSNAEQWAKDAPKGYSAVQLQDMAAFSQTPINVALKNINRVF